MGGCDEWRMVMLQVAYGRTATPAGDASSDTSELWRVNVAAATWQISGERRTRFVCGVGKEIGRRETTQVFIQRPHVTQSHGW